MPQATLYIIGTPIGNVEDITLRALRVLHEVDLVLAEDTRVTKKLLDRYEIKKPMWSYHQHSGDGKIKEIIKELEAGKNLALVCDAGTPGIGDPGGKLIEEILKSEVQPQIIPVPGANAAITALSISGFPTDRFLFLGFPPHKKGRETFFKRVADSDETVVFYESTHRIVKALSQLPPDREIMVARELTKKFETIYRGRAGDIICQLADPKAETRGEFVVVVRAKK